ncbi:MAG TPA: F0F1 ATP synthase subunit alpha, partial [Desulfobacterales bacterium]|nr:F0F1 ATP synthase subunit alpha [Desulfobacterales bacterium]
ELAAFAGFGSDLDKATQAQLTRGERLVEILKQPQYQPLPMEKQVCILYAGTRGFLDELPVDSLAEYERELYDYIAGNAADIYENLREKQEIDDALDNRMKTVIGEFTANFKAAKGLN